MEHNTDIADPDVTFDGVSYRLADGTVVPSVERILAPLRRRIYERHRSRPQEASVDMLHSDIVDALVHEAIDDADAGRLNEDALFGNVRRYVDAWRTFRQTEGINMQFLAANVAVYDDTRGYAGTVDRIIRWHGVRAILQLTTEPLDDAFQSIQPLRTAGLLEAYNASRDAIASRVVGRWSLRLRPDGSYTLWDHLDDIAIGDAYTVFQAAMTIEDWLHE